MINLLPKEKRSDLRAARTNVILLRHIIFLSLSILFMVSIFAAGYYLTTAERENAKRELAQIEEIEVQYSVTKKSAEEFEKNLRIAKSILTSEVTFSELVVDIAKSLPRDAVLTDLNLTTASLGENITLNARTKDAEGGLRLKSALQSSPYFENVSIQTITNPTAETSQDASANAIERSYPYAVVIGATLLQEPKATQTEGQPQ